MMNVEISNLCCLQSVLGIIFYLYADLNVLKEQNNFWPPLFADDMQVC
jgi:hypothetical protein